MTKSCAHVSGLVRPAATRLPACSPAKHPSCAHQLRNPGSCDGAGIATQLGHTSNHGDIILTGPDSSCPGGLANIHVDTLTAANGDSITITAHDVACPIGPLQFRGSGTWVVTAGTGRFSDATGAGVINGGANFATQEFSFVMSGTIAVP